MSSPFAAAPTETPTALPPNRGHSAPGSARALVGWLLMILFLYALYQAGIGPETRTLGWTFAWGWLLPATIYGGMAAALLVLRRRLPAEHRGGEPRDVKAEQAPPQADPTPIDVTLVGTDGARAVSLSINDRGLDWRADKRLLVPAAELHVAWDQIETMATGRVSAPLLAGGWMIGLFSLIGAWTHPLIVVGGLTIGVLTTIFGRVLGRGTLSFITATHALTFQSRALDRATAELVMTAARQRCPRAVAKTSGSNVLWTLFVEPFVELARACRMTSNQCTDGPQRFRVA